MSNMLPKVVELIQYRPNGILVLYILSSNLMWKHRQKLLTALFYQRDDHST